MKYSRVCLDALGYELAPVVVTSQELEARLAPVYERLRMPAGQLETLTGIRERRWWEPKFSLAQGAAQAGAKALAQAGLAPKDLGTLIYAGVCRENFEPATACHVANLLGVQEATAMYDVSNACLGVLNGMVDIANQIELGQIRAGMVVSCESAREINESVISELLAEPTMAKFKGSLATLTGGSGAVALVLTDGSFRGANARRLVGGVSRSAPEFHMLCRWGLERLVPSAFRQFMTTDAVAVLKHGVDLGLRTWTAFLEKLGWWRGQIDKVICHQVGAAHREEMLATFGIGRDKDFNTFPYLGNMGTVSLPLTAALAEEYDFLQQGDRVGFLGIGSGLTCLMLGLEW